MQVSNWLGHASYVTSHNVYSDCIEREREREASPAYPPSRGTGPEATGAAKCVEFGAVPSQLCGLGGLDTDVVPEIWIKKC